MADAESRKILAAPWAENGIRTDPEDLGIVRTEGWPQRYEQIGSGFEPELAVWNQRFRELDGWARDRMTQGIGLYDADINYPRHAFCVSTSGLKVALAPSGPGNGGAVDPETPDQTAWRTY